MTEPVTAEHPAGASAAQAVQVTFSDDLRRSRLTVFFRALLVIPHLFWLMLWGLPVVLVWYFSWFAGLFTGRVPAGAHGFLARYVRYTAYVSAYRLLLANPFPPFSGQPGAYVIGVDIPAPAKQSRLKIFFRGLLALWALIILAFWGIWAFLVKFAAWWYAMFTGRISEGMARRLGRYQRFSVRVGAYQMLLTERYPKKDD